MREFAQIALKCSFSRARFTGAIGLDAQFWRGLARNKTRSANAYFDTFTTWLTTIGRVGGLWMAWQPCWIRLEFGLACPSLEEDIHRWSEVVLRVRKKCSAFIRPEPKVALILMSAMTRLWIGNSHEDKDEVATCNGWIKSTLSAANQSRIPSGFRSKIFPSLATVRLIVRYPRLSSSSTSSTWNIWGFHHNMSKLRASFENLVHG